MITPVPNAVLVSAAVTSTMVQLPHREETPILRCLELCRSTCDAIRRFKLGSQIVVSKTPLLVPARAGPHLPIWRATTLKPGHVGLEFFSVGGNKAEAAMKYKGLEQIALEADVHPDLGMSRRERLER
jgi:hypothetical protein